MMSDFSKYSIRVTKRITAIEIAPLMVDYVESKTSFIIVRYVDKYAIWRRIDRSDYQHAREWSVEAAKKEGKHNDIIMEFAFDDELIEVSDQLITRDQIKTEYGISLAMQNRWSKESGYPEIVGKIRISKSEQRGRTRDVFDRQEIKDFVLVKRGHVIRP